MSIDVLAKTLCIETGASELTVWRFLAGGNVHNGNRVMLTQARARVEAGEAAAIASQASTPSAPHEAV